MNCWWSSDPAICGNETSNNHAPPPRLEDSARNVTSASYGVLSGKTVAQMNCDTRWSSQRRFHLNEQRRDDDRDDAVLAAHLNDKYSWEQQEQAHAAAVARSISRSQSVPSQRHHLQQLRPQCRNVMETDWYGWRTVQRYPDVRFRSCPSSVARGVVADKSAALSSSSPSSRAYSYQTANIHPSAANTHSSVANIHPSAANIHTSMANIHPSAANIHTSAAKTHSSAANIHTSAAKTHTSATSIHTSAASIHTSATSSSSSRPLGWTEAEHERPVVARNIQYQNEIAHTTPTFYSNATVVIPTATRSPLVSTGSAISENEAKRPSPEAYDSPNARDEDGGGDVTKRPKPNDTGVHANFSKLDLLCSATLEVGPLQESGPCSCPKSKCIALYCDCFKAGRRCSDRCTCLNCKNTVAESGANGLRTRAIQSKLARNPRAFTGGTRAVAPPGELVCNCVRSRCLKLYCNCFQNGKVCNSACSCVACLNTEEENRNGGCRTIAVQQCLEKRPDAFRKRPKVIGSGCACKNNRCIRKYCECFRTSLPCSDKCACRGCENRN